MTNITVVLVVYVSTQVYKDLTGQFYDTSVAFSKSILLYKFDYITYNYLVLICLGDNRRIWPSPP